MKLKKLILILFAVLITGCASPGINSTGVDLPFQEEDEPVKQKRVEDFIGEPKNTVFEELGNPISCEIIDDSEYCVYTAKESDSSFSATIIIYPIPLIIPYGTDTEWIHCYLLEFGKDKILERVDHKIVEVEIYDYPNEDELCYGMFGVPLSIPK